VEQYGYAKHGVIIYRHVYDNEMYAYDATCVDNADCVEHGMVRADGDNPSLGKCQRCGAQYTLSNGIHTQKLVRLRPYDMTPLTNATQQWRISNW